ncbi:TPA: SDR family oxidoreductase [Kluyvera ascorbata]|uniref:NAD(P)-dependent oxidoreductase n=1 Tax=Kluyvera genomosp. 2 TaxID=2774054 RepID=A0A2T2Y248_9ENTR|nr:MULTISPECIES: SDR family oxidoreductase [Enterobacteriaceae]HAT3918255.1 SDR family oxidoreductase [Kluyvera ascorbata]PSR46571.1 NAD(P)-dependent oxidoreductase [Kluyvera genomosp. 2]BBQ83586.1 NAD-dependent dehydratase [Klebsiella sp. WP3-W18-ESBL-02]BBR20606.1 NAD-dependent dehydratase [Klebsiella sp. WP3-S18-ESBL-05]HAT3943168.1 SDR family oxidoreductase [Kluyvera ascorbata]
MKVLIVGATGSIGRHVVEMSIKMGHQPKALVRSPQKSKLLPQGVEIVNGDVSVSETLTGIGDDIDAVIFTLGSDGLGRIGARAIDYGGVRNILQRLKHRPVKVVLMTAIGVTEREGSYNRQTQAHDWKRRAERLVRASGHPYTIVRPGWFDYNKPNEQKIVMLQGDRRHSGTPADGVISRKHIARVLVCALTDDDAKNKTLELITENGKEQQSLTPLFSALQQDSADKNDGIHDINNMPLDSEPECVIRDLSTLAQ